MKKDTARQLERQITYYAGIAVRTASRDRVRLAHVAIAAREQRLRALASNDDRQKEKL